MDIFIELSIIIGIATIISAIVRILRQPLMLGYIITGLIVGPYVFNLIESPATLELFSHLGIAFLLFVVGLNLSPRVIREVGFASILTGLGQIIFTTAFGFLIAFYIFHFSSLTSLYIAIGLTFSSTIIVLKLLADKGDLQKLYGKISVGFLLIQDIVAMIILIAVSALGSQAPATEVAIALAAKGIILIVGLIAISIYIFPRLGNFFASSQEFLFLFSASWGLCLAALVYKLGFSLEIGALAAGISLSVTPYHYEISSKLKPLRDFFIIIFFIMLGSQMAFGSLDNLLIPAIVFSIFVLIGNPLIVIILMAILGYNRRTNFLAGLTVAQISEFSLILIMLGIRLGHLNQSIITFVTLIALITIAVSSYFFMHADKLYPHLSKLLSLFEKKKPKKSRSGKAYQIYLFGYNRIGYDIVNSFNILNHPFLIIDFDPAVIKDLQTQKIPCLFGDADDSEFLDDLSLKTAKLVVSTIPDFETNMFLIEKVRDVNKKAIVLVVSYYIDDAKRLYVQGASYVLMPHFLGAHHASLLISRNKFDVRKYAAEQKRHLKYLDKRKSMGHEHPGRNF